MMRLFLPVFLLFALIGTLSGQTVKSAWKQVPLASVSLAETAIRGFEPLKYTAYTLDYNRLAEDLKQAPKEFTAAARQKNFVLSFPNAAGAMERFAICEVSAMMPRLAAKRPEIRTYGGVSLENPGKTIRFTISPYRGFEGLMLLADKGVEYLEPLAERQTQYYMAYNRLDIPQGLYPRLQTRVEKMEYTPEMLAIPGIKGSLPQVTGQKPDGPELTTGNVKLKVYRFACAATGEFTVLHGGKDAAVAKLISTTNSLNAIYERDLNIRLKIIDDLDKIVFTDPATDPYTGTTVGEWMNQNTLAMYNALGTVNSYDVGHVFAVYQGGSAIGVAGGNTCSDFRGRGCSAWYGLPFGDEFFAIVGQEIGHQWNGGHTFNQCQEDSQYNYDSACEPGSGSTIMSYSGACGSNNVTTNTFLYYHYCSIEEINRFVYEDIGNLCGFFEETDNNHPVATVLHPDNFFIPVRTPFQLKGTGSDPDGDALTYAWDETDLGPTTPLGSPVANSPLFRWLPPTAAPTRIFPQLSTILNNQSNKTELLPTYSRDLTFALVARDNKANGGGLGVDEVRFRSTDQAGPFVVTYPNATNMTFTVGSYEVITWDVANTDRSPVNCKNVNILLSTDGGQNFSHVIASNIPNNGRYCMEVPNLPAASCRIKVEAADNIFFDLSNYNFKIIAPAQPAFGMCPASLSPNVCVPYTYEAPIYVASLAGYNTPVTFSLEGLAAGASAQFTTNPVTPGSTTTLQVTYPTNTVEFIDTITLKAVSNGVEITRTIYLNVLRNFFDAMQMLKPNHGENGVNTSPWLHWKGVPDADKYHVQVATSPAFGSGEIVAQSYAVVPDSFKVPIVLDEGKVYYWRLRPSNACIDGSWMGPNAFVTRVENCNTFTAGDLPKNISANGTPTVESKISVLTGGLVSGVNIKNIQGSHTSFKDLEVSLVAPNGASALLFKNKCGTFSGSFSFGFNDNANTQLACPPNTNGTIFRPAENLINLTNQDAAGIWILRVKDNQISSGGSLGAFELELCSSVSLNGPVIVINLPLIIAQPGASGQLGPSLLKAEDANTPASGLTFTLVSLPDGGDLKRDGVTLGLGSTFTQTDIDNGLLSYFDNGQNPGNKNFRISVSDGEGGLAAGIFNIYLSTVGTLAPLSEMAFKVSPNPASDQLNIQFEAALDRDALLSIYDATGRLMHELSLGAGTANYAVKLPVLPSGLYSVAVKTTQMRGVHKILIRP